MKELIIWLCFVLVAIAMICGTVFICVREYQSTRRAAIMSGLVEKPDVINASNGGYHWDKP